MSERKEPRDVKSTDLDVPARSRRGSVRDHRAIGLRPGEGREGESSEQDEATHARHVF